MLPWSLLVNMIDSFPASISLAARYAWNNTPAITGNAALQKQVAASAQTQWEEALSAADFNVRIWVRDMRANGLVVQPSDETLRGAAIRILLSTFINAVSWKAQVELFNKLLSELRAVENI